MTTTTTELSPVLDEDEAGAKVDKVVTTPFEVNVVSGIETVPIGPIGRFAGVLVTDEAGVDTAGGVAVVTVAVETETGTTGVDEVGFTGPGVVVLQ